MATRANISVPDDVKERMKAFPGANWSAIATDAFRRYMGEEVPPTLVELADEVRRLREVVDGIARSN